MSSAAADGFLQMPVAMRAEAMRFGSFAQRLGCAYVIEGSMLGTQVLRKRLAASLGGWPARWLQGYGEEAGRRWRVFLEEIDRGLPTDGEIDEAAACAVRAFDGLGDWMRRGGAA